MSGEQPMKTCTSCGVEKPRTEFYRHSGMADGRRNQCRDCFYRRHAARNAVMKRFERAKQQGIPVEVSPKDLLPAPEHCPCCGVRMERGDQNGGRATAPSLDRLIPDLGYTKQNTIWICNRCNAIKNDAGPAALYRVADWLWEVIRERGLPLPSTSLRPNPNLTSQRVDDTTGGAA